MKVKLELKKGEAVIKEGGDSFIGKLMAQANTVRIHKLGIKREVSIVKAHREVVKAKKAKKQEGGNRANCCEGRGISNCGWLGSRGNLDA